MSILLIICLMLPIITTTATTSQQPSIPEISGPNKAKLGESCNYTIKSTDPQGDRIYYTIRCSDDQIKTIELGPYQSGETITFNHCWCDFYQKTNPFTLRVKAHDESGHESDWGVFETKITNPKLKMENVFDSIDAVLHFLQELINTLYIIISQT